MQAMIYISRGNLSRAEELMDEAEAIDPDMEIVQMVRQVIDMQKAAQQAQLPSANPKSNKSKKRR